MPIRIPTNLPARTTLEAEGVNVMSEETANRQDIRPLKIALLNLMPDKIRTETQIARLIGASPLQVDLSLIKITDHQSKNTSSEHMLAFYENFQNIKQQKFDGFVITGAPVEKLPYEDVTYWSEIIEIFQWTQSHVHSTFNICWGAQAALFHFHKVQKHDLTAKAFGVFRHKNLNPTSPYLRGFSDDFSIPVSRWTEIKKPDLAAANGIELLMESDDVGPCLINDPSHRHLYMFNHLEYDSTTLAEEYHRDIATGKQITLPHNYFPDNNPDAEPENRWRSHAHLLFGNWINVVYQTTPYDLDEIGSS